MAVLQNQDQTRSTLGGNHLAVHRAVVASTSLLAITAAMGWADPALALGTCGAPSGGVANCNATNYAAGIEYAGADAIDDLTVNVGSFAGQSGAVTVTGGITVTATTFPASDNLENLYVGSNVTIKAATGDGELVEATSSGNLASVFVESEAAITAKTGAGIVAAAVDSYTAAPGAASSSAIASVFAYNTGVVHSSLAGVYGLSEAVDSFGINASAYAGSIVVNTGTVKTTATAGGYEGAGVASIAEATSYGAYSYATAASNASNTGHVTTSGGNAAGVLAVSKSDAESYFFGYATSSSSAVAYNAGSVTTTGAGSSGVLAESLAVAGLSTGPFQSLVTSTASAYNFGSIKTSGAGSVGLGATAIGEGESFYTTQVKATALAVNGGTIATTGAGSTGIATSSTAFGYSYVGTAQAGAYATSVNKGSIGTTGAGAAGVTATTVSEALGSHAYAYSEASAANYGSIKTTGDGSDGIKVSATGTTEGYYANTYASAKALNAGVISTTGAGSVGMYVLGGDTAAGALSAPYANASAVNTGSITTTGAGAAGIVAISSTYAASEFIYSAAHTYVANTGSIKTGGLGAAGIYAYSKSIASSPAALATDGNGKSYAGSTVVNAGVISTTGDGGVGMVGKANASAYAVFYAHAVTVSNMTNVGSVSTTGSGAYGIVSESKSLAYTPAASTYTSVATASSTVLNAGSVTTKGVGANAIVAVSDAYAFGTVAGATATATAKVTNAGVVNSAQGDGIFAVSVAYAKSGNATANASTLVINAGSVTAAGPGTAGVFAAALASTGAGAVASTTTVVNAANASIVASGAGSIGVEAEGAFSTVVTYAGSSIQGGTGVGAAGVYENGAENIISNAGSIGSGNDRVIVMNGLAANIIKNTGTITGYVTMHATGPAEQNVFYNYGTWVARGGNSDFTHSAGGGSNLVDETGGTIVVVGNQTFLGLDKFTNVGGLVTMTQAASAGLGARPAFETLTVSGDYEGIGGTLAVDASTVGGMNGDVFKVDGNVTGGTGVKVSILGAPGLTTGNGILLVDAHGTTGAANFTLDGNANGGHSQVDGAFEYNLAFVPGGGTSGDWFLQSKVYPGVAQFGQIQSSAALIADSANPSVEDLLNQVMGTPAKGASLDQQQQVASVDDSFVPSPNGPGVSGWGRFFESRFNVNPSGSPDANYKLRVDAVQAGIDYNWHNANNYVMVGGYVTPFNAFSDFQLLGSHIGTSGTAYGVYGLWFSGPWQAGLRLNTTDSTERFTDSFIGTNAAIKPDQKGAQAAVSYDMPLDWADFTPDLEVNYSTVGGGHFVDGVGDLVNLSSTNDFWGKLNGKFSWDVVTDRGLLVQPYVNLGLLYRGDTSTRVTIGAFSSATNVNGIDGDAAIGVNTNLAQGLSLSAQADYLAGNRVKGWQGFIGLRYTPDEVVAPQPTPAAPPPPPPPPPPPVTKTFIVFFDFNKSNLTAEAESVVSEAVKSAKTNGMVRVLITGHTDTVGSDSYNMGLSVRRAQSVKDEMVRQGMDGSGVSIEGKGFHDPLVPTGPGVREPQNRRAVIDLGG